MAVERARPGDILTADRWNALVARAQQAPGVYDLRRHGRLAVLSRVEAPWVGPFACTSQHASTEYWVVNAAPLNLDRATGCYFPKLDRIIRVYAAKMTEDLRNAEVFWAVQDPRTRMWWALACCDSTQGSEQGSEPGGSPPPGGGGIDLGCPGPCDPPVVIISHDQPGCDFDPWPTVGWAILYEKIVGQDWGYITITPEEWDPPLPSDACNVRVYQPCNALVQLGLDQEQSTVTNLIYRATGAYAGQECYWEWDCQPGQTIPPFYIVAVTNAWDPVFGIGPESTLVWQCGTPTTITVTANRIVYALAVDAANNQHWYKIYGQCVYAGSLADAWLPKAYPWVPHVYIRLPRVSYSGDLYAPGRWKPWQCIEGWVTLGYY